MKGRTEGRTFGRTYGRTYVRTVVDVMAIKPNFLASMGYQCFLSYGPPRAELRCWREIEMFSFPILNPSPHFTDVEVIAFPTTCLGNDQ